MIEMLHFLLDFILNLDEHLVELLQAYGVWIYAILFIIVFAETGLVVTPWLPGDSLLFAVGTLIAIDSSGTLDIGTVFEVDADVRQSKQGNGSDVIDPRQPCQRRGRACAP